MTITLNVETTGMREVMFHAHKQRTVIRQLTRAMRPDCKDVNKLSVERDEQLEVNWCFFPAFVCSYSIPLRILECQTGFRVFCLDDETN